MSDGNAGESSNQGASSSNATTPRPLGTLRDAASTQPISRAIGNVLNRRPTEGASSSRGGRMMFMPNKVVRRKVEDGVVVKQEPSATTIEPAGPGRGAGGERGQADGRGRGRGRGRGGPPLAEMIASGPFALGPAANSTRRPTRITAASIPPPGQGGAPPLGTGLTDTAAPTLDNSTRKLQKKRIGLEAAEKEQYSEDEGVEVVDMDDVNELDWMAPDSLIRVKEEDEDKATRKRDKLKGKIKDKSPRKMKLDPEDDARNSESLLSSRDTSTVRTGNSAEEEEGKNLANALDLSESEEDEELEDLVEDFLANNQTDESLNSTQDKLYYFQFPRPFPNFELPTNESQVAIDVDMADTSTQKGKQKVSFAENTKEQTLSDDDEAQPAQVKTEEDAEKPSGGIIGQLEIYRSGLIKMRLGDGIVMEVTAATQPSFLQHAIYLDDAKNRLVVLGEVNRRFIVSPDVDLLLDDMVIQEEKQTKRREEEAKVKEEALIRMDD